ncbi:MAG: hypothetical protein WAS21_02815 [Geminicoccaceae bacterium]
MAATARHHGLRCRDTPTCPTRAKCTDEPEVENRTSENRIGTNEPTPAKRTHDFGSVTSEPDVTLATRTRVSRLHMRTRAALPERSTLLHERFHAIGTNEPRQPSWQSLRSRCRSTPAMYVLNDLTNGKLPHDPITVGLHVCTPETVDTCKTM